MKGRVLKITVIFSLLLVAATCILALNSGKSDPQDTRSEQLVDLNEISQLIERGDYDTAKQAFEAGASHITHLYNAMNPINHRAPGPVIAAAENENVTVELICDGVHVHPAVVRNTLRMFGTDRVIFISDSMEATGMPDGYYELGGQKVIKHGNRATLEDGYTIAGSVTNLMDCMRTAVREMNIPLETAVKCSAVNSARAIGLDGSIHAGGRANLVALDDALNIAWVMKNGKIITPS